MSEEHEIFVICREVVCEPLVKFLPLILVFRVVHFFVLIYLVLFLWTNVLLSTVLPPSSGINWNRLLYVKSNAHKKRRTVQVFTDVFLTIHN